MRVDGVVHSLTDAPKLKKQEKHDIEVVVDRLTVKPTAKQRLTDSVETALNLADGIVVLEFVDHEDDAAHREQRFSEKLACPNGHPLAVDDLEPRSFSFNSPYGACPECVGLGIRKEVDPDLVVPDPDLTLAEGAVAPWSMGQTAEYFTRMLAGLGDRWASTWTRRGASCRPRRARRFWRAATSRCTSGTEPLRPHPVVLRRLRGRDGVPAAPHGADRLRADEGTLRGLHARRSVPGLRRHPAEAGDPGRDAGRRGARREVDRRGRRAVDRRLRGVPQCADPGTREQAIAGQVLKEVQSRLGFLLDVGLEYLSLSRAAATLSGGEAQRIRLATQIGSGLVGVLYVLDEPSIGLHQRDNRRLIETLMRLRDLGNTLIVVEHDLDTIAHADWVVDIGPPPVSTAAGSCTAAPTTSC